MGSWVTHGLTYDLLGLCFRVLWWKIWIIFGTSFFKLGFDVYIYCWTPWHANEEFYHLLTSRLCLKWVLSPNKVENANSSDKCGIGNHHWSDMSVHELCYHVNLASFQCKLKRWGRGFLCLARVVVCLSLLVQRSTNCAWEKTSWAFPLQQELYNRKNYTTELQGPYYELLQAPFHSMSLKLNLG